MGRIFESRREKESRRYFTQKQSQETKESIEKVFEIKVRVKVLEALMNTTDKAKFEDALSKEQIEELRKIAEQQEENRPEGDT